MFACSDLAAEAVFGKKRYKENRVTILPNAVDTKEFLPNAKIRTELRMKYGLEDKFVIGHVGRFHYAKNHEFLLEIFAEIARRKENAVLMLLGDGPLKEETMQQAKQLGIAEKVIFTGNQTPVAPFYQVFDFFLFPSRFEGLPGTVVEAQAAGLKCLISDTITRQVKATELVNFMSIEKTAKEWADVVFQMEVKQKSGNANLSETNFDVNNQVTFYKEVYSGKNEL